MVKFNVFWDIKVKANGDVVLKKEELDKIINSSYEAGYSAAFRDEIAGSVQPCCIEMEPVVMDEDEQY